MTDKFYAIAGRMKPEDEVLVVLDRMFELCDPIAYKDFNFKVKAFDAKKLWDYERLNRKVGLADVMNDRQHNDIGISTMSIIATITDILVDKRLAFQLSEGTDRIVGVQWYKEAEGRRRK